MVDEPREILVVTEAVADGVAERRAGSRSGHRPAGRRSPVRGVLHHQARRRGHRAGALPSIVEANGRRIGAVETIRAAQWSSSCCRPGRRDVAGATVGVGRLYKSRAPAPIARPLMPTANLEQARQGMTAALNREAWSEHHPTTLTENEFIEVHGFAAYAGGSSRPTARTRKVPDAAALWRFRMGVPP